MPDPLDYENPLRKTELVTSAERTPDAPPAAVVPVEFDAKLSESNDLAGITAVEAALRASKIAVFRTDDGKVAGRTVTLYVRAVDLTNAATLAGGIFARRARVRKVNPPPEKDSDALDMWSPRSMDVDVL